MAKLLRQSTASQEIPVGRMVDSTDGNTAETGLTIANSDIKVWKAGATTLVNKNSGGATHISGGIYYAVLDATDTDTLGPLKVFVQVAGALPWEDSYNVVPAVIYDALVAGTGSLNVNTVALGGNTSAANNLRTAFDETAGSVPWLGVIDQGTAQAASATGLQLRAAAAFANNTLVGATIAAFGSAQGYWQTRIITANASSGNAVTVDAWTVTPSGTVTYKIFGTAPAT